MSQFPCVWCRKFVKRGRPGAQNVSWGLCISCAFTANGGFAQYGSRAVRREQRRRYGSGRRLVIGKRVHQALWDTLIRTTKE